VCACATGSLVNGRKCATSTEYLVYATRTELRSEHLEADDGATDTNAAPFNPVKNLTNVVGVDFDYKNGRLFYTQIQPVPRLAWTDSR
jgi:low density lipoprotein-related protein 2